jgi:NitT/TauT family transport system substrate-binding protein
VVTLSSARIRLPAFRPSHWRLHLIGPVLASLAVAVGITGCNPFSQVAASSDEPVVKVGVVPGVDNATLYLAKERGYFADAGINVQIVTFTSADLELKALSNGRVDVAAGDYGNLFGQGKESALQKNAYMILADGYDAAPGVVEIMTMPDSPVKQPADLANRVIGAPDSNTVTSQQTGAPNSLLIASATSVLTSFGVNLSGSTWQNMSQQQEVSKLIHGQLHAVLLTEPYIYQAEQAGAVELVDACSGATAGIPLSGYFASKSWSQDKTQEVAAFRAGLTQADAQATMPGPIQAVLPRYAHLDRREAALITTGVYPLSTITANLQRTADLLWRSGIITKQLDVAKMIAR